MIVCHADGRGRKGIGLDNVCAGREILRMDVADGLRLGNREQIVVAFERMRKILETLAPEICFREIVALEHCAHGAVEDEDALLDGGVDGHFLVARG